MVNKHKVLQDWVKPFLENNYLYFQTAEAYANVRVIVPDYGDYVIRTDICGFKYKTYTFVFIGYEQVDLGSSDVNVTNMQIFDMFNEWLVTQQKERNFPDFGENCDEYEIVPIQNMANLATIEQNGLAKYMLAAKINYREE
jgi:hypothetical protein